MFGRSSGWSSVVEGVFGKAGRAMAWAMPALAREQLVLFPISLDEVVPEDYPVRVSSSQANRWGCQKRTCAAAASIDSVTRLITAPINTERD